MLVKEGHIGGFAKSKTPYQHLARGTPGGLQSLCKLCRGGGQSVSLQVEADLASALISCVVWGKRLDA